MTENEYLLATNRAKLSAAICVLGDILPYDEYGISPDEYKSFMEPLYAMNEKLLKSIDLEESV